MRGLFLVSLLFPSMVAAAEVRLAAVGDVFFGRYLHGAGGHGVVYSPVSRQRDLFSATAPILQRADVAFANLETPVMDEPRRFSINSVFTFRADPDKAAVLAQAGFDVVSLANNHMTNLGVQGARETRRHAEAAGLHPVGAGATLDEAFRPQLLEKRGLRLCFLAYTLWNNDHAAVGRDGAVAYVRHRDFMRLVPAAVRAARRDLAPDFIIVSLHWGEEYEPHPSAEQQRHARALVDAGADVVLGHHPHVLQDFERYHGGVIAYSLGNFLFDNPGLSRRQSAILQVTLSRSGAQRQVKDALLTPVLADVNGKVPRPAVGRDHRDLVRRLKRMAPGFRMAPPPPDRPIAYWKSKVSTKQKGTAVGL